MSERAAPAISRKKNLLAVVACAIFLIAFAVTSWTAWLDKSAVYDEPMHLMGAWMQTHYDDFRCNPEDPPLWKFYAVIGTSKSDLTVNENWVWPLMLRQIPAACVRFANEVMYRTPGNDADAVLRAVRARMLLLGVVLGALIAWWAWRLAGAIAAVVAAAAFCFDPNFLAHSILVKNDVPIALVFLAFMAFVWLVGERATPARCAGLLLLAGAAMTTKFSGILTLPMLAAALFCRVIINSPWPVFRWTLSTRLSRSAGAASIFLATLLFAYGFIWVCYGFRFGPSANPGEIFDLTSRSAEPIVDAAENEMLLQQHPVPQDVTQEDNLRWVKQWKPSATVKFIWTCNRHHLLPQAWIYGFAYTYATSLARRGFLCGQIRSDGWWYYFPLAMLFKTPVATLMAFAIGTFLWAFNVVGKLKRAAGVPTGGMGGKESAGEGTGRTGAASRANHRWAMCAALIAPIFYFLVAMRSHLNIGLRHIFPVYPFLFIFIGVMAAWALQRFPRASRVLLVLLFLALLAETFAAYPNFVPFFNSAVGGARGGLHLLSDSNIDWGQDLPAVAKWQAEYPDRQLFLGQFSLPDPRYYGIRYIEMPGVIYPQPDETQISGLPPAYIISAVSLQGTYTPPEQQKKVFARFMDEEPVAVLGGGAMYVFDHPAQ